MSNIILTLSKQECDQLRQGKLKAVIKNTRPIKCSFPCNILIYEAAGQLIKDKEKPYSYTREGAGGIIGKATLTQVAEKPCKLNPNDQQLNILEAQLQEESLTYEDVGQSKYSIFFYINSKKVYYIWKLENFKEVESVIYPNESYSAPQNFSYTDLEV